MQERSSQEVNPMNKAMYKYRFSIFTATYNRASDLEKLSEFILNQTFKGGYEWVIVSDGSTDNTDQIVDKIKSSTDIPIKYISKDNGGKHTAWRAAMPIMEGQYVITCDDDDPVELNLLEEFDKQWSLLEESSSYDSFWEIRARCKYEDGRLVGPELGEPYFDTSYIDLAYKHNYIAEMISCRKIEVLRTIASVPENFLFEDKCSNFPESVRWACASRKYKSRVIPAVLCTYVIGHESLCTTTKRTVKKDYNSLVSSLYCIKEVGDCLLKYRPKQYLRMIILLAYSSIRAKENIFRHITRPIDKMTYVLFYLPAYILFAIKNNIK